MSQRDRLLGRRIPPTTVTLRVDFSPAADAAFVELEQAEHALRVAELHAVDPVAARERVEQAKTALDPFLERLTVAPLAADRYEELVGEHPPTDAQRSQRQTWNTVSFVPALLAACIGQDLPEDERMTEKDWAEWASTASASASGELVTLFNACIRANDRSPDVQVGKG